MREKTLILGSGIAGVEVALLLEELGFQVILAEKSSTLGGLISQLSCKGPEECQECNLCQARESFFKAISSPNIRLLPEAELLELLGEEGNFQAKLRYRRGETGCIICDALSGKGELIESKFEVPCIVLNLGAAIFDPRKKAELGYGRFANVLTNLELEDKASRGDLEKMGSIAFIHCVGSRDLRRGNKHCSSICCTFTLKEALMVKQTLGEVDISLFLTDLKLYEKREEKFQRKAEGEGIKLVRSMVAAIDEEDGRLKVEYTSETGGRSSAYFDLVILSTGFEASKPSMKLCERLGIELRESGFNLGSDFLPACTSREGILACGMFSSPKDIRQLAAEAGAAAYEASKHMPATLPGPIVPEILEERAPKVGLFFCTCRGEIAEVLDPDEVLKFGLSFSDVALSREVASACSPEGLETLREVVLKEGINRIVILGCSPKTHEEAFMRVLREVGLSENFLEMVNIREQISRVHRGEGALKKAQALLAAAVAKLRLASPVKRKSSPIEPLTLVVGGGLAGMECALSLARRGFEVALIEKEPELGGAARGVLLPPQGEEVQSYLNNLIQEVGQNPRIQVWVGAKIEDVSGSPGKFITHVVKDSREEEIKHGLVILALGGKEFKPSEYFYGQDPRVLTLLELEERIARREEMIRQARDLVLLLCAGSRNEERPYCSQVCCLQGLRCALGIKGLNPIANVYVLYRDIRVFGFDEELYREARSKGIIFIRYTPEDSPKVKLTSQNGSEVLTVEVLDPVLGERFLIEADLLALGTGIVPAEETGKIARLYGAPLDELGFLQEDPVELSSTFSSSRGVFLAGLAQAPKLLRENLAQAKAAAAKALPILRNGYFALEPGVPQVSDFCSGCGVCESICHYGAVEVNREKKIAEVSESLCRACGSCCTVCPSVAIERTDVKASQVLAALKACLSVKQEMGEPVVVGFCCDHSAYLGVDEAGLDGIAYPPNLRLLRVSCAGSIKPEYVLSAFNLGADGVLILACHPGACHYGEGNLLAKKMVPALKFMLPYFGVDKRRLRIEWIAAAEGWKFAHTAEEFVSELKQLKGR